MKSVKCVLPKCDEKRALCNYLISIFQKEVKSAINPNSFQPYQETYFRTEANKFSELNRVTDNDQLSREEKLNLISRPAVENIRNFMLKFLSMSHVTPEILIYGSILLDRFLKRTKWTLRATNWRILFMLSVRLALRVEEQPVLSTECISELYPLFSAKELQSLEAMFLRLLDYRCFVRYEDYFQKVTEIFS
eukprot:CAMPEP_0114988426 /NCGR_PEP_ID=MMETSP0216-20121206/9589_1 /TAXON_ID=223996 /ORGANISM="Protocruzia adherens, Strain Boccale" /LENGTH=191 /DNA_ID=CAMNT_0002351199 /DNA_START=1178 /DNA_END=1753 /DNA_ORIENTATION=-